MPKNALPTPTLTLSRADARRFILAHQRLWPPRRLRGKAGILDFIRHVGCIQFDPINVVGNNPHLVLQARVGDYRPPLLDELLYTDRQLIDGWDKAASIFLTSDWPYFARHRAANEEWHAERFELPMQIVDEVLAAIREGGPLSSLDLKEWDKVEWTWGNQVRLGRAVLEMLYGAGKLVVYDRTGTRRTFELAERVLPADLLVAPDPNSNYETYQNWHILRRVGGLGLANPRASEYWLGLLGVKTRERRAILARLVAGGDLVSAAVEDLPGHIFYLRAADLPTLEAVQSGGLSQPEATILGPLDNFVWDRDLLRWLFDFDYVWEVYKPVAKRKYGYYVLPVLYGGRFVARFDPAFDKKTRRLSIRNWWWEAGVEPDQIMRSALVACFRDFARYLDASQVELSEQVANGESLDWVGSL